MTAAGWVLLVPPGAKYDRLVRDAQVPIVSVTSNPAEAVRLLAEGSVGGILCSHSLDQLRPAGISEWERPPSGDAPRRQRPRRVPRPEWLGGDPQPAGRPPRRAQRTAPLDPGTR